MRNRISIAPLWLVLVLAAVLAFQSAGWLLAWQGMQLEAKWKAQAALFQDRSGLPERSFEKGFFASIQVDKNEIRLEGQLFDYRILHETSDSLRVVLYHDQPEEALLSVLGSVFQTQDDARGTSTPPIAFWLAQWLGAPFLLPEKPVLKSIPAPRFARPDFARLVLKAQLAPGIFAPPPEA